MLSQEDKEKCAELYEWATGEKTNPNDWNENAADLLSAMYAEISGCSAAMNHVPRPPTSKPGWVWLITYVYQALSAKMVGNKNIYNACVITRAWYFRSLIGAELGN